MPSLLPKAHIFDQSGSFELYHGPEDSKDIEETSEDDGDDSEGSSIAEDLSFKPQALEIEELREEARELLKDCKDGCYTREFLLVTKKIQEISQEVNCPLDRKELKRMKMDPPGRRAWKPTRQRGKKVRFEDDRMFRITEACQKMLSILNKVTPTTKAYFTNEFTSFHVSSNDHLLTRIVKLIINKAITEPLFCSLYVEIFAAKAEFECEKYGRSLFREALLNRFERILEGQMVFELTPKTKIRRKTKLERIEIMTFLGQLYRHKLVSCIWIINNLTNLLSRQDLDNDNITQGLHLLQIVGDELAKEVDHSNLKNLLENLFDVQDSLSLKNRFKLIDLVAMSKNHWRPVPSKTLEPKTIEEVRQDAQRKVGRVNVQEKMKVMTLKRMGSGNATSSEAKDSGSNDVRKSVAGSVGLKKGWFEKK